MSPARNRTTVILVGFAAALILLGHQTPAPEWIKGPLSLLVVLILPGWALATAWPRLRDEGIDVHLGLSVPLSLVLVSALVVADFIVPLKLIQMAGLLLLGTFVLVLMAHKLQEPRQATSRFPWMFWVAAAALTVLCFWGRGPVSAVSDGPDHLSTVREILKTGELFPNQGLIPPETVDRNDPRKGVMHVALALAAKIGNTDPKVQWVVLPGVLALSALSMLFALGKTILGRPGIALIGALLTLLCLGGEGARWVLHVGYGAHTGLWIAWGALWVLFAYLRDRSLAWLGLLCVLLMAAEAVHPLAPLFFFLPAGLTMMLEGKAGKSITPWLTALGVGFLLVSPALALRLREASGPINPLHETVSPTLVWGTGWSTLWPGMVFNQLGLLGVLGILLTPVAWKSMADGPERRLLVGATLAPLLITLVPGVFDLATRATSSFPIKSLSAVPAFFVIAQCLVGSRWRAAAIGALSVLAAAEAVLAFRPEPDPMRTAGLERTLAALRTIQPPRTVVADPWTSYLIASETDHYPVTVVGQHGHPLDVRGAARLDQIETVFSEGCSSEKSKAVLDFYGHPLVVIPPGDAPLWTGYGASRGGGVDVRRRRHLEHLGARETGPGIYALPDPLDEWMPEVADRLSMDPPGVRVEDPSGLVSVEFPEQGKAGRPLPVVMWWTRGEDPPYQPLEAHLRLEAVDFKGGFKPWRKMREALGQRPPSRWREVHSPFDSGWPRSCWVPGAALADTLVWSLPPNIPQGLYTLQVRVLEQRLMPRIHLADVLWDADRWQGTVLGTVDIR